MVTDLEDDMSMFGQETIDNTGDLDVAKQEFLGMIGTDSHARKLSIQASDVTSTCDGTSTEIDSDEQELSVMEVSDQQQQHVDVCESVLIDAASDEVMQDNMLGPIPQAMPAGAAQLVAEGASIRSYQAPSSSMYANTGCMGRASNQECKRCGHQFGLSAKFCINCGTKRDVTLGATGAVEWGGHVPTQVAIPPTVSPPPGRWNMLSNSYEPVPAYKSPPCAAPCAEVAQVPPAPPFNNVPPPPLEPAPTQLWTNHQVPMKLPGGTEVTDYPVGMKFPLKISCQKDAFGRAPLDPTIPAKKKIPSWTQRPVTSVQDLQALLGIRHQAFTSRCPPPNFDRDDQSCIQQ